MSSRASSRYGAGTSTVTPRCDAPANPGPKIPVRSLSTATGISAFSNC